jgi:phenylalanyl-tRNA synthetase alpha chain
VAGGQRIVAGHLHPLTQTLRRVQEIMSAMGFVIVEGPEVEEERYDFDALNIPLDHPARAEADSFYVHPRRRGGDGLVLRTSTSAVQVRAVIENDLVPPFKIASPGRVFRKEKPDPTHESIFYQLEALTVANNITIADYRGVTETLFSTFFGRQTRIRLRPGYFPFVEPGFEVDMTCVFCEDGCRVCKHTGWVEMGGAGMVHPNVLKNMNIDPRKFQGFAFGYGLDRLTMLWHNIEDIRLFWSGDIRFLRQFS